MQKCFSIFIVAFFYLFSKGYPNHLNEQEPKNRMTFSIGYAYMRAPSMEPPHLSVTLEPFECDTNKEVSIEDFEQKLYITYIKPDNTIGLISEKEWGPSDNSHFTQIAIPTNPRKSWYTRQKMSLSSCNGKLYHAHVGTNDRIYLAGSEDGRTWRQEDTYEFPTSYYTTTGINLSTVWDTSSHGGNLCLAYVDGMNNTICIAYSRQNEKDWPSTPQIITPWKPKYDISLINNLLSYIDEEGTLSFVDCSRQSQIKEPKKLKRDLYKGLRIAKPFHLEGRLLFLSLDLKNAIAFKGAGWYGPGRMSNENYDDHRTYYSHDLPRDKNILISNCTFRQLGERVMFLISSN